MLKSELFYVYVQIFPLSKCLLNSLKLYFWNLHLLLPFLGLSSPTRQKKSPSFPLVPLQVLVSRFCMTSIFPIERRDLYI